MMGWAIGSYAGRPYLERHGRWLHVTPHTLDRTDRWFERYGDWAVALGRVTPVVRSFIAIPSGIAEVPFGRYTWLTIPGSLLWAFAFAAIGYAAGASWEEFHHAFRYAEYVVAAAIAAVVLAAIWRHRRGTKMSRRVEDPAR
jgi:membrane protein DedA with SNARE-associated domain